MATNLMSMQLSVDNDKVNQIAENMKINGWVGVEMVIWNEWIITGNHRYAAAQIADIAPETITLEEVFAEAGLDFDEEHEAVDWPAIDDRNLDQLLYRLPDDIYNKYGIQC